MYDKLPRVDGHDVCSKGCGPKSDLALNKIIATGLGSAGWSQDGVTMWQEGMDDGEYSVLDVEKMAKKESDSDWRIFFFGPLWEGEYQRQGDDLWVLVKKWQGFA